MRVVAAVDVAVEAAADMAVDVAAAADMAAAVEEADMEVSDVRILFSFKFSMYNIYISCRQSSKWHHCFKNVLPAYLIAVDINIYSWRWRVRRRWPQLRRRYGVLYFYALLAFFFPSSLVWFI